MLNIALLAPRLQSMCGRSRVVYQLINGIDRAKFKIYLVTDDKSDLRPISMNKENRLILKLPESIERPGFLFSCVSILNFIRRNKIDILHSHHRYYELICVLLSKIFTIKTVTTVHSIFNNHKFLSFRSKRIVAVSEFVKQHLVADYKLKKEILVVYNGVENLPDGEEKTDWKKFVIIAAGRLVKEKSYELIIKAISISAYKKKIQLIIIGRGNEEKNIMQLSNKLGVNTKICYQEERPFNYYEKSDLLVMPSSNEGFGLTILEAGIKGIPVIAADSGGPLEIITENEDGILFRSGDFKDLSRKIDYLIEHPDVSNTISKKFKHKIVNKFSLNKMLKNYEELYLSLGN